MLFKAFFTGCLLMAILFMTIKTSQNSFHARFLIFSHLYGVLCLLFTDSDKLKDKEFGS